MQPEKRCIVGTPWESFLWKHSRGNVGTEAAILLEWIGWLHIETLTSELMSLLKSSEF